MKKIIFSLFSLGLLQLILAPTSTYAATSLQPGDIFIITANSDAGYPGGTNSNAFEFVAKVDLDTGTQIYFAEKNFMILSRIFGWSSIRRSFHGMIIIEKE